MAEIALKEPISRLFERMNADKAFAEKILSQTEKEKIIELAKEEGIVLTLEDIDEANAIIRKSLELKINAGELSEEELEKVAGGTWEVVTLTVSAVVTGTVISATMVSPDVVTLVTIMTAKKH